MPLADLNITMVGNLRLVDVSNVIFRGYLPSNASSSDPSTHCGRCQLAGLHVPASHGPPCPAWSGMARGCGRRLALDFSGLAPSELMLSCVLLLRASRVRLQGLTFQGCKSRVAVTLSESVNVTLHRVAAHNSRGLFAVDKSCDVLLDDVAAHVNLGKLGALKIEESHHVQLRGSFLLACGTDLNCIAVASSHHVLLGPTEDELMQHMFLSRNDSQISTILDASEAKRAAHLMPERVLIDRGPQQGSACVQPLWKGTSLMAVDFLSNYIVGTFLFLVPSFFASYTPERDRRGCKRRA